MKQITQIFLEDESLTLTLPVLSKFHKNKQDLSKIV